MMMSRRGRGRARARGYAFLFEYVVLWAIVAATLISMGLYMKRALMGGWRQVADGFGFGRQYEPTVNQ